MTVGVFYMETYENPVRSDLSTSDGVFLRLMCFELWGSTTTGPFEYRLHPVDALALGVVHHDELQLGAARHAEERAVSVGTDVLLARKAVYGQVARRFDERFVQRLGIYCRLPLRDFLFCRLYRHSALLFFRKLFAEGRQCIAVKLVGNVRFAVLRLIENFVP